MAVFSFEHFKSATAHELFVHPADGNYFLARFCFMHGLYQEFFWQALQALEKYLKAGLILNGGNAKQGHNISGLYEEHKRVFGDLAVIELKMPAQFNPRLWQESSAECFLKVIGEYGQPDGRYGLTGYQVSSDLIHKLDFMCVELRKRVVGLDWTIREGLWKLDETERQHIGETFRSLLSRGIFPFSKQVKPSSCLDELVISSLADVLHRWNFQLYRTEEDLELRAPNQFRSTFGPNRNPHTLLFLSVLKSGEASSRKYIKEWAQWMCEEVPLSGEYRKTITQALQANF